MAKLPSNQAKAAAKLGGTMRDDRDREREEFWGCAPPKRATQLENGMGWLYRLLCCSGSVSGTSSAQEHVSIAQGRQDGQAEDRPDVEHHHGRRAGEKSVHRRQTGARGPDEPHREPDVGRLPLPIEAHELGRVAQPDQDGGDQREDPEVGRFRWHRVAHEGIRLSLWTTGSAVHVRAGHSLQENRFLSSMPPRTIEDAVRNAPRRIF